MTAIESLRFRGCWSEAAALLESSAETDAAAAVNRATVLVERTAYTGEHWPDAEKAVEHAERLSEPDAALRADAALARSQLAYSKRIYDVDDMATVRARQAQSQAPADRAELRATQVTVAEIRHSNNLNKQAVDAVNLADDLLPPDSPRRGLLLLRTALIQRNIIAQTEESVATLRSAHERAVAAKDSWLLAQTNRLLAVQAYADGDDAAVRRLLAESLHHVESSGWLVGLAPALAQLALAAEPAEATRLRAEAARLVTVLGGVPAWLRDELSEDGPDPATEASPVSNEPADPGTGGLSAGAVTHRLRQPIEVGLMAVHKLPVVIAVPVYRPGHQAAN